MNKLSRLRLITGCLSKRLLHSQKYVIDNNYKQSYEDIFPQIYENDIKALWNKPPQCVYAGFDPTAESLHIGNLLVLVNLLHWHQKGHTVIILLGGATGLIGDPSYRKLERVEIAQAVLDDNLKGIEKDIENVIKNYSIHFASKNKKSKIMILNNINWYKDQNVLHFIKDVGKHFRMGTMLGRSSVQSRLLSESGMSFAEFTYPIIQAYDWLQLNKRYKCNFQIGGQDQMGNIISGHDLIARYRDARVYGMTLPLITAEGGQKFGKSTGNVIWLSPSKSSSFQLYQYFVQAEDAEVEKLLYYFTFLTPIAVKQIVEDHFKQPEQRRAQKYLAEKVTLLVHGEEGLVAAKRASAVLYEKSINNLQRMNTAELVSILDGANVVELTAEPGISAYELAMKANCFKTDQDARRIIAAGGFYINYQKVINAEESIVPGIHILSNNISLLRVGKKTYHIVRWL